ncbi:MAG: hypothetical protein M1833_003771 [Piccolia ochrophora]|nr:MAG: hypothetical protein M1833_003771 [Piccolia ochrophora]
MSADRVTTQAFDSPGFFAAAFGGDENYNIFESSFGGGNTPNERPGGNTMEQGVSNVKPEMIDPALEEDPFSSISQLQSGRLPTPTASPLSTTVAGSMGWNPVAAKADAQLTNGTDPWSYDQQAGPHAQNLLVNTDGVQARSGSLSQYGQITPPDSATNGHDTNQNRYQPALRKKHHSTGDHTVDQATKDPPKKRGRRPKNQSSGSNDLQVGSSGNKASAKHKKTVSEVKLDQDELDFSMPEDYELGHGNDEKRQKFLARNRVAASKCRDRKKHREEKLKTDVQELQNERNLLSMMVGDLKEQALYLKGELLKHSTCDCHRIRQYLNQEASNITTHSPHCVHDSDAGMSQHEALVRALNHAQGRDGSNSTTPSTTAGDGRRGSHQRTMSHVDDAMMTDIHTEMNASDQ